MRLRLLLRVLLLVLPFVLIRVLLQLLLQALLQMEGLTGPKAMCMHVVFFCLPPARVAQLGFT